MTMARNEQTEARNFCDRLSQFGTGVLITHAGNDKMHGRPMAVAQLEESPQGCDLWFMTSYDTPKMDEIRSNSHVLVTFQNGSDQFLTVCGRAELVRDPQKVGALWQDSFKGWFPQGKGDPALALIHVRAEQGEYWDNGGMNRVTFLLDAVKAPAKGDSGTIKESGQYRR